MEGQGAEDRGPDRRAEAELERAVERFRAAARGLLPRHCPVCGHRGRFTAFGHPPRFDARCPGCGALERHRLFALWLERECPWGAGDRVLHFAAERQLAPLIRARTGRYETADLDPARRPDHVVDICDTGLPGGLWAGIVCNHVLEHVDDARALAEMRRLLRPGGLAVITTPVIEGWDSTYENPAILDRAGRLAHFGQGDHVRLYGRDLRDRIRAAGFDLSEYPAVEPDVRLHGLLRGERLFLARKPEVSA
ncbi:methyltransferase domain-containing protein [Rubellimicrobium sp. CFH 75288]|uniref:methyltransferase domain-containing protein n=1 Tax=Rubellimicrobium sp. CFH 75288 TaxID=2697034 RepID=UPI0014121A99|nr:methyltransferase domain-containing protein [Rubellimicrobium sp. CFH 75288]NAZ38196.1 methyltransferase domain-containing protein [Rubellimicrobium sp. CFH 75288]